MNSSNPLNITSDLLILILNNSSESLCFVDKDMMIKYTNRGFQDMLNCSGEELYGRKWYELPWWQNRTNVNKNTIEISLKALHNYGEYTFEFEIEKGDIKKQIKMSCNKLEQNQGFLLRGQEISEMKYLENELYDQKLKYAAITNATSYASAVLNTETREFVGCNDQMLEMFGFKNREEFYKVKVLDVSPEYQPDGELSRVKAVEMMGIARKNGSNIFDWTHIRTDGLEFKVNVYLTGFGEQHEVMFCVFRKTEEEIKREMFIVKRELEALVKLKTSQLNENIRKLSYAKEAAVANNQARVLNQMIIGMAHELNTPLGNCRMMGTYFESILKELSDNYKSNKMSQAFLEESIKEMTSSIELLNKAVKITSRKIETIKEALYMNPSKKHRSYCVADVVNDVISIMLSSNGLQKESVSFSIDKSISIVGNQLRFYQVIYELIQNSIEHGMQPLNDLQIRINAEQQVELIRITYEDNGIGVNEADIEKIGDVFYTTKRNKGKMGLGLSMVNNFVLENNGTLDICDSANGFKLIITLPI